MAGSLGNRRELQIMKWYELRYYYSGNYSGGNTETCISNSITELKEQADRKESYNFQWEYLLLDRCYKSSIKQNEINGAISYYKIIELPENHVIYVEG